MKRSPCLSFLSATFITASLAACVEDSSITPPDRRAAVEDAESGADLARRIAQEELAKAAQGDNSWGFESALLRMEARVPGIGGMYFDPDQRRVVVILKDGARETRAVAAAREHVEAWPQIPERDAALAAPIEVREADYAFSELIGWKRVLLGRLARIPQFISIDADEYANRVRITVQDGSATADVESVLATNGIPLEAVQVEVAAPGVLLAAPPAPTLSADAPRDSHTLRDRRRPAWAGMEIENDQGERCSHGFTALDASNTWGFLTASHCRAIVKCCGLG